MARRTEALHVTIGDDYIHRLEVTLDAVAMDLSAYTVTSGLTRGSTAQAFTVATADADLGILLFTLQDAVTVDLEQGLWRFWVRTALAGVVTTWLTGPVIVDTTGAGADRTVIEYTDDATAIVLETSGIPIGGSGAVELVAGSGIVIDVDPDTDVITISTYDYTPGLH